MKNVQSELLGKQFEFGALRHTLEGLGFIFGETFTYTYAAFDYELHKSKIDIDYYLRIFVDVVSGRIEKPDAVVQVNNIEILKAKYHSGFLRDDDVPEQYVKKADEVLKKVHAELGVSAAYTIV